MAIYTKKGDRGTTSTLNKKNISKNDFLLRTIGAIDETNTFLGLVISFSENHQTTALLQEIQKDLFKIGSILAGAKLKFSPTRTKFLEKNIDTMQNNLPKLKNFILPGGSKTGAVLHTARVVCRRAERNLAALSKTHPVPGEVQKFANRLSDLLFVLARKTNHAAGSPETIWKR